MMKEDARREALRLWRNLAVPQRQTFGQAQAFASTIEPGLDFLTMGDKLKVVTAWLQKDLLDLAEVRSAVRRRVTEKQKQERAAG